MHNSVEWETLQIAACRVPVCKPSKNTATSYSREQ